jgi:hypothetical protein
MARRYPGVGRLNREFLDGRRITAAIYSQFLPFVTDLAFAIYQDFAAALYSSL